MPSILASAHRDGTRRRCRAAGSPAILGIEPLYMIADLDRRLAGVTFKQMATEHGFAVAAAQPDRALKV